MYLIVDTLVNLWRKSLALATFITELQGQFALMSLQEVDHFVSFDIVTLLDHKMSLQSCDCEGIILSLRGRCPFPVQPVNGAVRVRVHIVDQLTLVVKVANNQCATKENDDEESNEDDCDNRPRSDCLGLSHWSHDDADELSQVVSVGEVEWNSQLRVLLKMV